MEFQEWLWKSLGVSILIMALLLALAFLVSWDIKNRSQKIQNQRSQLTSRLQALDSLVALKADVRQADALMKKLEQSLPPKDQLIGFSKYLESLAKNNKLGFGFTFDSEEPAKELAPGINNFTLTGSGSLSNFIQFLRNLEASQYLVSFNSFDLSLADKNFEIVSRGKAFSQ